MYHVAELYRPAPRVAFLSRDYNECFCHRDDDDNNVLSSLSHTFLSLSLFQLMQKYTEANNGKFPDPYAKIVFEEEKKEKKKKKKKLNNRVSAKKKREIDANGNRVRNILPYIRITLFNT